ncbi:hypothetical protein ACP70R_018885 [Stipagrostis hirtigluma subsp. patula]
MENESDSPILENEGGEMENATGLENGKENRLEGDFCSVSPKSRVENGKENRLEML